MIDGCEEKNKQKTKQKQKTKTKNNKKQYTFLLLFAGDDSSESKEIKCSNEPISKEINLAVSTSTTIYLNAFSKNILY